MGKYRTNRALESSVKSNRGIVGGDSGGGLPVSDNLKLWVHPEAGLSFNAANFVDKWADQSGNGNDLLQSVETNKPLYVAGMHNGFAGVKFDATDNALGAAGFTWNQPETIYFIFNPVTWSTRRTMFDGNTELAGSVYQLGGSPTIGSYAGSSGPIAAFLPGQFHIGTMIFNGAGSVLQRNDDLFSSANAGANNMGGFHLGAYNLSGSNASDIEVLEVAGFAAAHSAGERTQMKEHFSSKYNIAL